MSAPASKETRLPGRPRLSKGLAESIRQETLFAPDQFAKIQQRQRETGQNRSEIVRTALERDHANYEGRAVTIIPPKEKGAAAFLDTPEHSLLMKSLTEKQRQLFRDRNTSAEEFFDKAFLQFEAQPYPAPTQSTPETIEEPQKEETPLKEEQAAKDLWEAATPSIKKLVNEENFATWLSDVRGFSEKEGVLTLSVPTLHLKTYLTEHYTQALEQVLREQHTPRMIRFELVHNHKNTQEESLAKEEEQETVTPPQLTEEENVSKRIDQCIDRALVTKNPYQIRQFSDLANGLLKKYLLEKREQETQSKLRKEESNKENNPLDKDPLVYRPNWKRTTHAWEPDQKGEANSYLRRLERKAQPKKKPPKRE